MGHGKCSGKVENLVKSAVAARMEREAACQLLELGAISGHKSKESGVESETTLIVGH